MNTRIHQHHPGPKTYVKVWFSLMILTALTVYVATINLGMFNIVVAMLIASVKASIVALYFMHLKFEDKLTWVYALYPVFLLFLLIASTLIEAFTRVPVIN